MKLFYDTEFIERGPAHPIDLISIGMVAEDGRELYAVSSEFDVAALHSNGWLVQNVWPSLPKVQHGRGVRCKCMLGHLDTDHPDVRSRAQIARLVADFVQATPDVELWAWYGAYDHVALCQLWGRMIDLPSGVPMFTNDLKQEAVRLGDPRVPVQASGEHNALADARHCMAIAGFLAQVEQSGR